MPSRSIQFLLTFACSFFLASGVAAQSLGPVTIKTFDGSTTQGTIDEISTDGTITGSGFEDLNLSELVEAVTDRKKQSKPIFNVTIELVGGGTLQVRKPTIADEKVSFQSNLKLAEIPLEALAAIVWKRSPVINQKIADPSSGKDAVIVETANGEAGVEGLLEGLDESQLRFNYENKSETIGAEKLKALVMADLGLGNPPGSLATIQLADGSSVRGSIASMTDGQMTINVAAETQLKIPISAIAQFSIQSDRRQFLSDLDPIDVQQKTDFAVLREWKRDRSVGNHPLSIRYGKSERLIEYSKGLGTQAFTQLAFANEDFDRFTATVGIDAETKGRGDCRMVVRGDGIELWSQRIRGDGDPVDVNVDISGMSKITLVVYPGADFDLADHANWCNASFERTK